MVDVIELQDEIIRNPDYIVTILEAMEYTHISDKGKYYTFPHKDGDNMNANSILKATLQWQDYSRSDGGSLISLVEKEKNCTFRQALEYISGWIGFKGREYKKTNVKLPFGGFYKSIDAPSTEIIKLPTYDDSILPEPGCLSYLWLKDGVDLKTQESYRLRLDLERDRLVIPAISLNGDLIGAKFRMNSNTIAHDKRFGMVVPYKKTHLAWGANHNYHEISKKRVVFVVESEKSVCILSSMGFNLGVAVGGHNISEMQSRQIRTLFPNRIIVAFDSDVCQEEVEYEAKKLVSDSNLIYKPKVGYIYDNTGLIMSPNEKVSPVDHGYEIFKILAHKCLHWVN